jgi:hypothetical protein
MNSHSMPRCSSGTRSTSIGRIGSARASATAGVEVREIEVGELVLPPERDQEAVQVVPRRGRGEEVAAHAGAVRDRVREDQGELARTGVGQAAEGHGGADQLCGRVVVGTAGGGGTELVDGALVDLERDQVDQLLVAVDVAVERRRGQPHAGRDRAQREPLPVREQGAGDPHDLVVRRLALALAP